MAPIRDGDGFAEQGLLSKESFESGNSNNRTIIIKSSRRHSILYTSICVLIGMAVSLAILTITSTVRLTSLEPITLSLDDLGLNPPLKPGEDPVENGPWCGQTPDEAKAKGCKFDVVLYSWVPPPCYDHEIQVAYLENRESEWYRYRGAKTGERVSQEQASKGVEEVLWLSWDYHDYHCQYIWKMMTRILRNSSMGVPGRLLEYYHTDHCIHVLKGIEKGPAVDVSTKLSLNYSTCYSRT